MQRILIQLVDWLWYRAIFIKWLLWPISVPYGLIINVRHQFYRWGIKKIIKLPVPVIVVGNISVGGTGKTPIVMFLSEELQANGYKVGIISRGYGGNAKRWPQRVFPDSDPSLVGDEPVLLAQKTQCPVMVGPDRVAAARALLSMEKLDLLLSDDGLQHYQLGCTLEIVVVDGTRGLGNGLCLPAGPLREFSYRLSNADVVIVNGGEWGRGDFFRVKPAVKNLYQASGSVQKKLEEFKNQKVHAVAGIGNPNRFFDLLNKFNIEVLPHPLPDHATLNKSDLTFEDDKPVFITEKDAVKCEDIVCGNVWCVPIKIEFQLEDKSRFMSLILRELKKHAK